MVPVEIIHVTGLTENEVSGGALSVFTPVDGSEIAKLTTRSPFDTLQIIANAKTVFADWRNVPAPRRRELVQLVAQKLRQEKENLGRLVSLECGKIYHEGLGEVREMTDICDLAAI